MNDPTAEASPVSSHPVMSKPDQNNNEDDKVSAAVSSPGPVLQSINRIMHREPLATIVHGVYWIVVLSVAVPVSLWVLVLRTLYLLVRRPRYLVFEQSERKEIESAGDDDQEEGLAEHAIFITGCDSGFGHELAVRAATATATTSCGTKGRGRHPFVVFAGCYNKENVGPDSILFRGIDNVHALLLDVTQDNHVQRAVQQVEAWLQASQQDGDGGGGGGEKNNKTRRRRYLHAVINNAGVGYGGDADWLSTQQIQHTMDGAYMSTCVPCVPRAVFGIARRYE